MYKLWNVHIYDVNHIKELDFPVGTEKNLNKISKKNEF